MNKDKTPDKLKELLDFLQQVVLLKRTGCVEVHFSQGGVTRSDFKERVV